MTNPEDIGNAFKTILNRLREFNAEEADKELSHTCNNCKYRHGVEGYDQQWGMVYCVRSWCDKDRSLMDSIARNNNHYITPCDYFEAGGGVYEEMSERERRHCGL